MSSASRAIRINLLLVFLVAYAAASLFHHVHNAEFLGEYPSMPAWLSRAKVYAAWLGVTAVGAVGYFLVRSRYQPFGLVALGIYGLLGFDGLGHYAVGPLAAHTFTMNLTIWLEVATGAALLAAVAALILERSREHAEGLRR